jgi:hypothetical protein
MSEFQFITTSNQYHVVHVLCDSVRFLIVSLGNTSGHCVLKLDCSMPLIEIVNSEATPFKGVSPAGGAVAYLDVSQGTVTCD